MAIDLKVWLRDMGVAADKIDTILPDLTPAAGKIESYGLSLAEATRRQTELDVKTAELATANERLNLEMVEWGETRAAGEPITAQMRTDLAAAKGEVARLQSVITTKAAELGLDPKTVIGEVVPVETKPAAATPDLTGYVKATDLDARLGQTGRYLMTLTPQLIKLGSEHLALTGEVLDPEVIVAEIEARATDKLNRNTDGSFKKPIEARAIWEEKFGIPEKRAARAAEVHTAELKAAEDRGYERRATEQALPGQQPVGRHSPILRAAGNATPEGSKATRPSQAAKSESISKAASALATHKYRTSPGQPAAR